MGSGLCRKASVEPAQDSKESHALEARQTQKLRFLLEEQTYTDTLHERTLQIRQANTKTCINNGDTKSTCIQDTGCSAKKCTGSILAKPSSRSHGSARPREDLTRQARDFIEQYYGSIGQGDTLAMKVRLSEVLTAIRETGTYELTYEELIYGAKTAWRNAPRCIGRIQWTNLKVFDARKVKTAKAMFECLCTHMEYATNKGNIRSTITIFPPRTDGKHDFRIWNPQLIRYAGYRKSDGSITGDPASVTLTELCQKLGWKGEGGRFDILPMVLQADGHDPEFFDIPPELALEVPLTHPQYPWFGNMGLRWYALPAVANMMLDCGGLEFTGAPFNGWYMGTEVGARDMCDQSRYNITETVAVQMGLDVKNNVNLWKDKAMIEVNVAVLHSYQKAQVTMIDHHLAAQSFLQFFEKEHKARGGCPADWVWIVPPISGSLTPVFHQEMLNYQLKPSYEYMTDGWLTHKWKGSKTDRKITSFKVIAWAVMVSVGFMRKALAARVRCTVLYATETGRSERFARTLCKIFQTAFDSRMVPMDVYDLAQLPHEKLVLIVASTFGNGDPPGNALKFNTKLMEMYHASRKKGNTLVNGHMRDVSFSVFALGSNAYPNFCAFGKHVDNILGELKARQLLAVATGDEQYGQEQAFSEWSNVVFQESCNRFEIESSGDMKDVSSKLIEDDQSWSTSKYRLSVVDEDTESDLDQNLTEIHKKKIVTSTVVTRSQLQTPESERQTLNIRLRTQGQTDLDYVPGDRVAIFPANRADIVQPILDRVLDAPPPDQTVVLQIYTRGNWSQCSRLPVKLTLRTALTRYLDVTTPPTVAFLALICDQADDKDKRKLQKLVQDQHLYGEWRSSKYPSLSEVLEEFSSVRIPASLLLSQLPLLQPRNYSISSSPDMYQGEIHVTVAVVEYKTDEGRGQLHHGVCSGWMDQLQEDDPVPCFVRSAPAFHLPDDPSKPVIMVGPGTGLAPLRSFWQQRAMDKKNNPSAAYGAMSLYFGCRRSDVDDIYKAEKQAALASGVLTELHTALSRDPEMNKTYVQDLLRENAETVNRQIAEQGGHFYVCGDVDMADDVRQALRSIIQKTQDISEEEAERYTQRMREENRFHEDIFGVAFRKFGTQKKQ